MVVPKRPWTCVKRGVEGVQTCVYGVRDVPGGTGEVKFDTGTGLGGGWGGVGVERRHKEVSWTMVTCQIKDISKTLLTEGNDLAVEHSHLHKDSTTTTKGSWTHSRSSCPPGVTHKELTSLPTSRGFTK